MPAASLSSVLEALDPLWAAVAAVGGVALGWHLNRKSAAEALVAQQRRQAASQLLDELVEARLKTQILNERERAQVAISEADDAWRRAVLRYSGRIGDEELTRRVDAASVALHLARTGGTDETRSRAAVEGVDLASLAYIVERAFLDVFVCLDALLNDRPLPDPSFPPDPMRIITEEGDAVALLRAALNDYDEPERTARTRVMLIV